MGDAEEADTETRPALELVDLSDHRDSAGGTFAAFYDGEYVALLRLAWTLLGHRAAAEDAVQETMLAVHRRWDTVRDYDRPGAYARRVLLNKVTSLGRRSSVERRALRRLAARTPDSYHDTAPPDEAFWAALRQLPDRQLHVVALHYLEDRPVAEIAAILHVNTGTVKTHLHRARNTLAELLDDATEEHP